jgi:hypothetical protein
VKLHQRQLRPYDWNKWTDTNFALFRNILGEFSLLLKFEVPLKKKGNGKHRKTQQELRVGDYFAAAVLLSI